MDDDLTRGTAAGPAKDGGAAGGRAYNYYEWALASFYIAYIAFEWMSLLWSRVPAHAYVAGIVLSWGAVASLQAVATSYPVLIALRFLLGVGEAGFTGIPIYLSFFFRREELALRTAIFISGKAWTPFWLLVEEGGWLVRPDRVLTVESYPISCAACHHFCLIPRLADHQVRRERAHRAVEAALPR